MILKELSALTSIIDKSTKSSVIYLFASGLLWFGVESLFVLVIQIFFFATGLTKFPVSFFYFNLQPSLLTATLCLIGFGFFRALAIALKQYSGNKVQQKFLFGLRKAIVNRILENPELESSSLAIFGEFSNQAGNLVFFSSLLMISTITSFLLLIYGFYLAPFEMIIGLSILLFLFIPLFIFSEKIKRLGSLSTKTWEKTQKQVSAILSNSYLINLYQCKEEETSKAEFLLRNYSEHFDKYALYSSIVTCIPIFLGTSLVTVLTFISLKHFHRSPITLISFLYIFIRLTQVASEGFNILSMMKMNFSSFQLILNWMKGHPHKPRRVSFENEKDLSIELDKGSFHHDSQEIFSNLSFHISKGMIFQIKGRSGSGKSTLIKVISGSYPLSAGFLKISGISEENFHSSIAYCGPNPFVLSDSILNNVLFGNSNRGNISEREVYTMLEKFGLAKELMISYSNLNSAIIEPDKLSTGQQHRLSLIRSFLRNPKIMIIDEALSNLDANNKVKILEYIKEKYKEKIVIIVNHDNDTLTFITNSIDITK